MGCATSQPAIVPAAGETAGSKQLHKGDMLSRLHVGDDRLELAEFTAIMLEQKLGLTTEQTQKMFAHADKDGNGWICTKELADVVSAAQESAMSVPVRIIIPSTQGVDGKIAPEAMQARCHQVIEFMASTFGGATESAPQRGGYQAESGKIVYEEVRSITSFCTQALWRQNLKAVRGMVADRCKEWGQECIGLDFDGVLEFIYPEEPSPEALWRSVVPRIRKRHNVGMTSQTGLGVGEVVA